MSRLFLYFVLMGGSLSFSFAAEPSGYRNIMTHKRIQVAAHRGARQFAPECSLAAFRKGVELNADMLEIDVRRTKDGVNVIMHDPSVNRTTDAEGRIDEWNFDDLRKLSIGKWFSPAFESEMIPTLEETCQAVQEWNKKFGKQATFYVDCKNPEIPDMIDTLRKYGFLETSVFYGNDGTLLKIRGYYKDAKLITGYGSSGYPEERIAELKPYALDTPWVILSKELMDQAHQDGIKIFSDAPGDANVEELAEAIQNGIDLIQTDRLLNVYQAEETAIR